MQGRIARNDLDDFHWSAFWDEIAHHYNAAENQFVNEWGEDYVLVQNINPNQYMERTGGVLKEKWREVRSTYETCYANYTRSGQNSVAALPDYFRKACDLYSYLVLKDVSKEFVRKSSLGEDTIESSVAPSKKKRRRTPSSQLQTSLSNIEAGIQMFSSPAPSGSSSSQLSDEIRVDLEESKLERHLERSNAMLERMVESNEKVQEALLEFLKQGK